MTPIITLVQCNIGILSQAHMMVIWISNSRDVDNPQGVNDLLTYQSLNPSDSPP